MTYIKQQRYIICLKKKAHTHTSSGRGKKWSRKVAGETTLRDREQGEELS